MSKEIGRLSRLGFSSLPECLLSSPKEYRDYLEPMHVLPIADTGIKVYMVLTLTDRTLFDRTNMPTSNWKRGWRLAMRGVDGRGQGVDITVFGSYFPWMEFQPGDELHLYGQVTTFKGKLQIGNPDLVLPEQRGRIVPIYAGKPGQVSGDSLAKGVAGALSSINEAACMLLAQSGMREAEFRRRAGMEPEMLLASLHTPKSTREGEMAAKVATELSLAAILGRAARNQSAAPVTESALPIDRAAIQALCARLPFSLTGDQAKAIDEVVGDLRAPFPMRRLLSGDVGTGKSIVFMVPAVAAFNAGARVAIVVPNQLLVEQIAGELRAYYPEIPVQEVTSGAQIGSSLVVGTSAVIHAARKHKLEFDLVIVDEQHKFSVEQKDALRVARTNFLEATATAIPRTLALVGFGGMAVSVLRELPVVKKIATRIVEKADGARLFDFVHAQIAAGGQVAVIYPLAEDMGDGERASVEAAFERFKARYGDRAGMLHGKLSDDEKAAVINKMRDGELSLLVSSTVIEVGVTLPSLRALVVVHPERFGVSQLHQLRGRVARKGGSGYFFLYLPAEVEDMAMQRLELLVECSDGFTLAERDADLRGFGNVDAGGDAQTGSSRLLFWGVNLTRQDIERGAERLGLLEAA
ncbi:helicase-related protein [Methylibium petroleiphilum]|uniref:RecG-like helicase n=1 Tax=Methylibium petroleiphilum (strain ATCC BAA-1232 / LMG 22953 / PM1) TaxID=420662 RepID=A2SNM5_METPP|nr:helicase-related protein [Methylibium petroleiphilum]ABM97164.1 RecG-like helicase [Methylibium petroleiphilum PM1]